MDEATWLTSTDAQAMLDFFQGRFYAGAVDNPASARKLRLACHALMGSRDRPDVDIYPADPALFLDGWIRSVSAGGTEYTLEGVCAVLRDLFHPFAVVERVHARCTSRKENPGLGRRIVQVADTWLTWRDGTIVTLARSIYEERAFERMGVLADALEEANCGVQEIIVHCRADKPHFRGCWCLDLLLGKE
jgi:hypothetical protein